MIDSCREMDSALKYDSVESFVKDDEYFKLTYLSSRLNESEKQ